MKASSSLLLLFSSYVLGAPANGAQGYLSFGFQRHASNSTGQTSPQHRQAVLRQNDGVSESLKNKVFQYLVSYELGSPGQSFTSALDTGSSDLWVYSSKVSQATYKYDSSSSSSSKYVSNDFDIEYVDGSGTSGDYYTDKVTWGDASFDMQFAVTDSYEQGTDDTIFGVGFKGDEATQGSKYNNLPYALKDQGVISSTTYSLYLDDVDSSTGVFLLGAVDKSRYSGELTKIPFTSSNSFSVDFEVGGKSMNGVLDSGTSLTYLDDDTVASIAKKFGATYNFLEGLYTISGNPSGEDVDFTFSGTNITVPAADLIIEEEGSKIFGLVPSSAAEGYTILGDVFLRSAYVVYDLDNKMAGIAKATYGSGSSDIQVLDSGL